MNYHRKQVTTKSHHRICLTAPVYCFFSSSAWIVSARIGRGEYLFFQSCQASTTFGLGVDVRSKDESDQVEERDPGIRWQVFLSKDLGLEGGRLRGGTKVSGLTIQEIFMTGRNPTLMVALTCSIDLAPAVAS